MSKKRLLTYNGKTLSVDEWARASGVPPATIRSRLDLLGWDVERALSEPVKVRFRGGGRKPATAAGVSRWNPHRLRKARATEIDKAVGGGGPGARAAAGAIGDTVETVRRHYLDGNDEPLIELARRTG